MNEQVSPYVCGRDIVEYVEDHYDDSCTLCEFLRVYPDATDVTTQGHGEPQKDLPWLGT